MKQYYDLLAEDGTLLSGSITDREIPVMMEYWADLERPPVFLVRFNETSEAYVSRIILRSPMMYGSVVIVPFCDDLDVNKDNVRNGLSKL